MSDLQTAYYIYAIVFMSIILVMILALLVVALKIRSKVNEIHQRIDEKVAQISDIASKGSAVLGTVKKVVKRTPR